MEYLRGFFAVLFGLTVAVVAVLMAVGMVYGDPATAVRCADGLGGVAFFTIFTLFLYGMYSMVMD